MEDALLFLLTGCLSLSLYGYLQLGGWVTSGNPYFLITGPYKNPSVFAGIMVMLWVVPAAKVITGLRYRRYNRLFMGSLVILDISAPLVVLSGSRASWLALLVAFLYLVSTVYKPRIRYGWRTCLWVLLLGGVTLGGLYGLYTIKKDSADGRLLIWKVSLEMIREKPLTGFGPGGFTAHYMHYQARYLQEKGSDRDQWVAGSNHLAYNEPVRIWVEYGVVGVLIYIALVVGVLFIPGRRLRNYTLKGVVVAYLVWGLFNFPAQVVLMQGMLVITLALLSRGVKPICLIKRKISLAGSIGLIFLIACMALQQYCLSLSYTAYQESVKSGRSYEEEELMDQLAALEPALRYEPGYWVFYCSTLNRLQKDALLLEKTVYWEESFSAPVVWLMRGDVYLRGEQYKEAERCYGIAHFMSPVRQAARGRLVWLYRAMGEEKRARQLAAAILSEKVKVYGFDTYILHQKLRQAFGEDILYYFSNLKNTKE
ncbi:MAG: O-antigen ligase family protein [Bacteroides sp.]|nr:O-antigen ligase family protein [Bacteroides sp.]